MKRSLREILVEAERRPRFIGNERRAARIEAVGGGQEFRRRQRGSRTDGHEAGHVRNRLDRDADVRVAIPIRLAVGHGEERRLVGAPSSTVRRYRSAHEPLTLTPSYASL